MLLTIPTVAICEAFLLARKDGLYSRIFTKLPSKPAEKVGECRRRLNFSAIFRLFGSAMAFVPGLS